MNGFIEKRLAGFEPVITHCLHDGHIPGMAIGIVTGGEVVYANGFGYRDIQRQLPVSEYSRFGIQSCTKALTAAIAGILVDRGQLEWDRPIKEYVPTFRMFDHVASTQATMRDLLSHQTGMPNGGHDWLRVATYIPRHEYLARLPYLEPSLPFRGAFQYSNLMYIVAGAVMEQVAEMSWEAMVRQWIFTPLGMFDSGFSDEVGNMDNAMIDYTGSPVAWVPADAGYNPKLSATLNGADAGPCGSICSSVYDMCRWLQVHLRNASMPGIISASALRDLHTAQIPCLNPIRDGEVEDDGCAMGWITQRYRGHRLVAHWGGTAGPTITSFMPDDDIGVIIHSNRADSTFHAINAITLTAYDRLLDLEPIPWHERWQTEMAQPFLPASPTDEPAERYYNEALPGAYHHPGYKTIHIEEENDTCVLRYGVLTFSLSFEKEQTLTLKLTGKVPRVLKDWWGVRHATVKYDTEGRCIAISIPFEPAVADIVFERQ